MSVAVRAHSPLAVSPAGALDMRQIARVQGRIIYIEVSPADRPPTLIVRLADDTGVLDCVFMGRRAIAGIEPGVLLEVQGRVAAGADAPVMFNPRYEMRAS